MSTIKKGWKDKGIIGAFNKILNGEVLNEDMSTTEALEAIENHQNEATTETTTAAPSATETENVETTTAEVEATTTQEGPEDEEELTQSENASLANQIAGLHNTILELSRTTFSALNELREDINLLATNNASVKNEIAGEINKIKGLKTVQPATTQSIATPKLGTGESPKKKAEVKASFLDSWMDESAASN